MVEYETDCKKLQKIVEKHGLFFSLETIEDAWIQFSDSLCASWIILDCYSDEELWDRISPYLPKSSTINWDMLRQIIREEIQKANDEWN